MWERHSHCHQSQGALPTGFHQGPFRSHLCLVEAGGLVLSLCFPLGKYVRLWLQMATSLWLVCGSHMAHFSVAGRMSSSEELLNCDLYQGLTDSGT